MGGDQKKGLFGSVEFRIRRHSLAHKSRRGGRSSIGLSLELTAAKLSCPTDFPMPRAGKLSTTTHATSMITGATTFKLSTLQPMRKVLGLQGSI